MAKTGGEGLSFLITCKSWFVTATPQVLAGMPSRRHLYLVGKESPQGQCAHLS